MNVKWSVKFFIPILALVLASACGMTNNNNNKDMQENPADMEVPNNEMNEENPGGGDDDMNEGDAEAPNNEINDMENRGFNKQTDKMNDDIINEDKSHTTQ